MNSARISRVTAVLSGVFALALAFSGWTFDSQLALAQAADSTVDFLGAAVLAWLVQLAAQPRDANHPLGHSRAEPIGALGVAMLAAVLAVQVTLSAIEALSTGAEVRASATLAALFVCKVLFKGTIFYLTFRADGPAMRALSVDARNDMLVGLVSVAGYIGFRFGYASLDAWLSFPVAAWIFFAGVGLARENIDLLMGAAPSVKRQEELLRIAASVPQVIQAHDLRAHHLGPTLSVYVHVQVRADLSLKQAHDIGEAVRRRLEAEKDVTNCAVHVDPDDF